MFKSVGGRNSVFDSVVAWMTVVALAVSSASCVGRSESTSVPESRRGNGSVEPVVRQSGPASNAFPTPDGTGGPVESLRNPERVEWRSKEDILRNVNEGIVRDLEGIVRDLESRKAELRALAEVAAHAPELLENWRAFEHTQLRFDKRERIISLSLGRSSCSSSSSVGDVLELLRWATVVRFRGGRRLARTAENARRRLLMSEASEAWRGEQGDDRGSPPIDATESTRASSTQVSWDCFFTDLQVLEDFLSRRRGARARKALESVQRHRALASEISKEGSVCSAPVPSVPIEPPPDTPTVLLERRPRQHRYDAACIGILALPVLLLETNRLVTSLGARRQQEDITSTAVEKHSDDVDGLARQIDRQLAIITEHFPDLAGSSVTESTSSSEK